MWFFIAILLLCCSVDISFAIRLQNVLHRFTATNTNTNTPHKSSDTMKYIGTTTSTTKQQSMFRRSDINSLIQCKGGATATSKDKGITGTCIGIDLGTTYR
jgi:hypothetical protein